VASEVQNISTHTTRVSEQQLIFLSTSFLSGPVVPEEQTIMCDATGGSFRLSFNGYITNSIPYNADIATITSALQQLAIINSVTVAFVNGAAQACTPQSATPGAAFRVTFTSVVGLSGNLPLMTSTTNSLQGLRRVSVNETTRGMAGIGGTFRLSYRGSMTTDISVFALASDIATALWNLDTLPFGGVNVTEYTAALINQQGRLWGVTFTDPELGGNLESLQVVEAFNAVTGSDVSLTVYADGARLPVSASTSAPASAMGNEVSGAFYLTLDGYTVGPIDFNVADTVLKTQLESLPNVGTVTVARLGPSVLQEYSWLVTFASTPGYFPPGTGNINQLVASYSNSLGGNSSVAVSTVVDGSAPLSGFFSLTVGNGSTFETTASIPADASSSELESYLNALNSIGSVSVARTVQGSGYSWLVTFDGCKVVNGSDVCNEGPVPLLTFDSSQLQCASSPLSVTNVINGVGPGTACPGGLCVGFLTDLSGSLPFTYVLNGLTTGVPYFVRVSAHNSEGYGYPALTQPEFLITTYNPPGAPAPVRLVSSTISTITVSWDFPSDNGGASVVGFELWMDGAS
jgi:hypothetical protein